MAAASPTDRRVAADQNQSPALAGVMETTLQPGNPGAGHEMRQSALSDIRAFGASSRISQNSSRGTVGQVEQLKPSKRSTQRGL